MSKVVKIIKSEIVLVISFVLAVGSMFFVPPDREYFDYIDIRTIALLFCLMTVTAGLTKLGVFNILSSSLLRLIHNSRMAVFVLCAVCFFSSMLITNDVALITFVPFTIIMLKMSNTESLIIPAVILETVSANLGSCLTPIGNPQNLYLYSKFDLSVSDIFITLAPYGLLSFAMIAAGCLFVKSVPLGKVPAARTDDVSLPRLLWYILLFVLALLTVLHIIPYYIVLAITVISVVIFDRRVLIHIDYGLLLTFVFLFVFIGNLGRVPSVSGFLSQILSGNEVPVSVVASQVFSNVPAAVLLSGFTTNVKDLLIGVNIGGLGTIIASMASLISFRYAANECKNGRQGRYLLWFTIVNVVFLAANLLLWYILK